MKKSQRIRDPLYNLIEFSSDPGDDTDQIVWSLIQTRPFQRLRRIRQLGFSEFVFPGATHTRFSHSIGAYYIARRLMKIIHHHLEDSCIYISREKTKAALVAALLHDVGHGMFSHAFEDVGNRLHLQMAHHESVSEKIIRQSEISNILNNVYSNFANDVADVISRGRPGSLYDAVVSSQFDADRLDYMRRDRLMAGIQNSAIDLEWLLANLEISKIPDGIDDQPAAKPVETLVLGPKAFHAAETYILALFQLYPTVYLHKTTRGAEKIFSALMGEIIKLAQDGSAPKTGLPLNHPFILFAKDSKKIDHALALDDAVFWGALPMLASASNPTIQQMATRLQDRKLPKCIDIGVSLKLGRSSQDTKRDDRLIGRITDRLTLWSESNSVDMPRILLDRADRSPYKRYRSGDGSKGPLNQIFMRTMNDGIKDMAELSPVAGNMQPFVVFRAYIEENDRDAAREIQSSISEALNGESA